MAWPYTYRWEKRSKDFLRRNPLCRMCMDKGKVKQAEVVDHIEPHGAGQDQERFWNEDNWQPLCKEHHDHEKRQQEINGYSKRVGSDGWPTDPRHPANDRLSAKRWPYSIPKGVHPSGIYVTLVAGPPGAGKSTFVREHAAPSDIIIDFDDCLREIGAQKWSEDRSARVRAFHIRDAKIKALAKRETGKAWLIVSAPTALERTEWLKALGNKAHWVVLDVPGEECKRRVDRHEERGNTKRIAHRVIDHWWRDYTPGGE